MKQISHFVVWFSSSSNHSSKLRQNISKLLTNRSILRLFHNPGAISCNWSAPAQLEPFPSTIWFGHGLVGRHRAGIWHQTGTAGTHKDHIYTNTTSPALTPSKATLQSSTGSGTLPTLSSKVQIYEHLNTLSSILVTALWENKHHLQMFYATLDLEKLHSLVHATKSIYF